MAPVGMRVLVVLTVATCWLTAIATATDVATATWATVSDDTPVTKPASDAEALHPAREGKSRLKAPDGEDRVVKFSAEEDDVQALAVADDTSATSALKATSSAGAGAVSASTGDYQAVGPEPVVLLITGSVVIAVVALAFQRRQAARKNEKGVLRSTLILLVLI
jgi:hypothetical protein